MTRSKLAAFLLTSNNNIPGSSPPASICRLAEMYDANSLALLPIFRHAADLSQKFLSGAASNEREVVYRTTTSSLSFENRWETTHTSAVPTAAMPLSWNLKKENSKHRHGVVPDASQYSGFVRGEKEGAWSGRTKALATEQSRENKES